MSINSSIIVFLDNETKPFGEFNAPINFVLDTRKLVDGDHVLKIVSKDPNGKEGIRFIPFKVRNGPAIAIEGIKENEVVTGVIREIKEKGVEILIRLRISWFILILIYYNYYNFKLITL